MSQTNGVLMRNIRNVKANGHFAFAMPDMAFMQTIASVSHGNGRKPAFPYKPIVTAKRRRQVEMPSCLGELGSRIS